MKNSFCPIQSENMDEIQYIKIQHIPMEVDLKHITNLDSSTNKLFLTSPILRQKIFSTLANKENGRYSKSQLSALNVEIDSPYAVIKEDAQIFMVYEGRKKSHHAGVGTFGVVKFAQNMTTGDWVALKNLSSKHSDENGKLIIYSAEKVNLLGNNETTQLSTVGKLLGKFARESASKEHQVGILMQLAEGIDLLKYKNLYTKSYRYIHPAKLLKILLQMCEQVKNLQAKNMLHCDLKLENFQFNPHTWEIKLTDFGVSRQLPACGYITLKDRIGTPKLNNPPESITGYYSFKYDSYGLGNTIAELLDLLMEPTNETENYYIASKYSASYKHNILLKDSSLLDEIYDCLQMLTHSDLEKRYLPADAINVFQHLLKDYLSKKDHQMNVGILDLDYYLLENSDNRKLILKHLHQCQKVYLISGQNQIDLQTYAIIRELENEDLNHGEHIIVTNDKLKLQHVMRQQLHYINDVDDDLYFNAKIFTVTSSGMVLLDNHLDNMFYSSMIKPLVNKIHRMDFLPTGGFLNR